MALERNNCSADRIMQMAMAFKESRILLTAYELDLFSALGDKSKDAEEVAKALRLPQKSAGRLMNALCATGLLKKKAGKFSNTPLTSRFLVKGKPEYMAGLMHVANLWNSWSTLTQAVRKGKAVLGKNVSVKKREKEWLTAFIAAMHERALTQAKKIVSMLDLSKVMRVLDVGAGSGAYAMAFARAKDGVRVRAFDLPNVVVLTRSYIKKEGLLDKIDVVAGDYNADSLGSGFDLIFLSAIVHSNSFAKSKKLIVKCVNALNPGGQVVVQDFIMDEDRTSPSFGALFSLNMLVATEEGDTYTESQVRSWMKDAGLSEIKRKDTEFDTALIIGKKI